MVEKEKVISDDRADLVWRSRRKRWYECGHRGSKLFRLRAYGENSDEIKQDKLCPVCFLANIIKHTIRCALCGRPIFPGEAVTSHEFADRPVFPRTRQIETGVYLGCTRIGCCPPGGHLVGRWTTLGWRPNLSGQV